MKGIEPKPTTPIGLNALLYQTNAESKPPAEDGSA